MLSTQSPSCPFTQTLFRQRRLFLPSPCFSLPELLFLSLCFLPISFLPSFFLLSLRQDAPSTPRSTGSLRDTRGFPIYGSLSEGGDSQPTLLSEFVSGVFFFFFRSLCEVWTLQIFAFFRFFSKCRYEGGSPFHGNDRLLLSSSSFGVHTAIFT